MTIGLRHLGCRLLDGSRRRSVSVARIKIRSRRCGAPMSEAATVVHCASYPRSARSPRTAPAARRTNPSGLSPIIGSLRSIARWALALRRPLTFSMTTSWGVVRRWRRRTSPKARSGCSSLMPARRPAALTSWQGKPPQRMSTGCTAVQSVAVMSLWLGMAWPAGGEDFGCGWIVFAVPNNVAAEHGLDGEVEATSSGEQAADAGHGWRRISHRLMPKTAAQKRMRMVPASIARVTRRTRAG